MVVRERVVSQKGLVTVERPLFHLAKALAQDHDLQYDSIDVAGRRVKSDRGTSLAPEWGKGARLSL